MAENDVCNYCAYKAVRSFYSQRGKVVDLVQSSVMLGWMAVLVDDVENTWFVSVPEKCECPKEDV